MEKEVKYSNKDITIVWKPNMCKHAGVCVKTLPEVYRPKEKPWVAIENAITDELIAQVKQCPSGALSFYEND